MSFRVGEVAKIALVGANGCGKTTLLRIIAGDLPPSEGTVVRSGGEPPEPSQRQQLRMRLGGGRTRVRALTCSGLSLRGLTEPFDLEVFYRERVAVLGANGTGKSHFLRLLAGWPNSDDTQRLCS